MGGTSQYFAPYVDATGVNTPNYTEINEYVLNAYLTIYAQNIDPGNNESDIQMMSNFALMINDAMSLAQLVYNSRGPATAVGSALDGIVKINGIARLAASYSTVALTITGTPAGGASVAGTIFNGVVQDTNGYFWSLPAIVVIGTGGTVTVTATCQTIGAIGAADNTVNIIATPTAGWNTVTNASPAIPGNPVEADSSLRARQALSVALSSKTLVDGTLAAIAAVPNVTRYGNIGIENPTGSTDSFGNPAHSISMVVEGGDDVAVATAIYNNKTPGTLTNGTTTENITDPISGAVLAISYFRPTYTNIYVSLTVNPFTGYTSATTTAIQTALQTYLNGLQIGESVSRSALYAVASSVMPSLLTPLFSITALTVGTSASPTGTSDISIAFNYVAECTSLSNIVVTT